MEISDFYTNFAIPEPAKPLYDAQMRGSFYFNPMDNRIPFPKQYSEPKELVMLLKSRGLEIDDISLAESYIRNIGYYRLSAYMFPFLTVPKENHIYKVGTNLNSVLRLYSFDKKLRVLTFNEIEKIEIAVRSAIVNIGCKLLNNPFWMTDHSNFLNQHKFQNTLKLIEDALYKSKEEFILHFKTTYRDQYPPAWMIAEILPFGNITRLFSNLKSQKLKKMVSQYFGLQPAPFESWLTIITLTRNACCHHARVWNSQNSIRPMIPKHTMFPWINNPTNPLRIYFDLCIIKYFLNVISPHNDFTDKIRSLLGQYPQIDSLAMGFPHGWESEPVWKGSPNSSDN